MPYGQSDNVRFDFFERMHIPVLFVQRHADAVIGASTARSAMSRNANGRRYLGEFFRRKRITFTQDRGAEQRALQLAHIARPVISAQHRQCLIGDAKAAKPRLAGHATEKMTGECGYVGRPFAQGGNGQLHHIQSII